MAPLAAFDPRGNGVYSREKGLTLIFCSQTLITEI
jgi:hypothetical protein